MFRVESDGFVDGWILEKYGIRSSESEKGVPLRSFPLRWYDPPEGTAAFAVTFLDYDDIPEEGFCWIHWLVADIPGTAMELRENESRENPNLIQGSNSWMTPLGPYGLGPEWTNYYGGPAPTTPHEYELVLYALDSPVNLQSGFYLNQLRKKMQGHILGKAVLKGSYK
jgi:hypothetical protein